MSIYWRGMKAVNHKRNYKEIRSDSKVHLAGLAELPPDKAALERFRSPAYQIQNKPAHRMTLSELVDVIYRLASDQVCKMSDPVPEELVGAIRGRNEDVVEYLARKYGIGGDTVGQAKTGQAQEE